MTYGYAWERCASGGSCTAIAGATTSSYVATTGDVGSTIVAAVTATNSAGSATASSAPTAAVTDPPPATVGLDAFLGKRTANVTGTAMTLKTATAASAGARIVVGITWSSSATLGSVKGGGLAWTVDAQTVDSSGNHAALASAAAPSGLAAGTTLKAQFSAGVTYGLVFAASFTGIAPTNAVDGSGSNAQAASRAWSAGVTAAAGDLVVAWATIDAIAADTPTQPYEQVVRLANSSFWGSAAAVWGVASTDGSQSVSGTWGNKSGATGDATVAVAYRPAG